MTPSFLCLVLTLAWRFYHMPLNSRFSMLCQNYSLQTKLLWFWWPHCQTNSSSCSSYTFSKNTMHLHIFLIWTTKSSTGPTLTWSWYHLDYGQCGLCHLLQTCLLSLWLVWITYNHPDLGLSFEHSRPSFRAYGTSAWTSASLSPQPCKYRKQETCCTTTTSPSVSMSKNDTNKKTSPTLTMRQSLNIL